MMKVKLRFGDALKIGDTTVKLEERSGQLACLVIDAPRSVEVRLDRAQGQQMNQEVARQPSDFYRQSLIAR